MEQLELFFWGYAEGTPEMRIVPHTHDFWQMNMMISGECLFRTEKEKFHAKAYDLLLIPPGIRHSLEYPEKGLSCSFKFQADCFEENTPLFVPRGPFTEGVIQAAQTILKTTFPGHFLGIPEGIVIQKEDTYQILMEHFLAGVVDTLYREERRLTGRLSGIYNILSANPGRYVSVEEAAEKCGLSRNRFSDLVRKNTGLSARDFLNHLRADTAKRYLRFSNKTIGEIAGLLGFSNQFHFSDFFKRMTGSSPVKYRKERCNLPGKESAV